MSKTVGGLLRRAAIAIGLIFVANLVVVWFWSPAWFTYWQVPISCTIFIMFLGITLYDTLFYDRPR
jgi:FtsH-binding integral membrane protein